jgi:aldehyde:ferredoxin oxidoreductase
MSGRFTYLAPLTHSVTTVSTGGKTLYRLRASGADAASLCGRLRVAGESCVVVN